MEVIVTGMHDGKPFQVCQVFLISLRTTPEALLQLVRERWSLESWHWIRDTQPREDDHRYRGNGAGVKASLRTAAFEPAAPGWIRLNPRGPAGGDA
jgi:predicted transposase YbfD/YdcC